MIRPNETARRLIRCACSFDRDRDRHRGQRSAYFGVRFSINAPMPSSASRASMFSTITSAA